MTALGRRIVAQWTRIRVEAAQRASEAESLVVNLAMLGYLCPRRAAGLVVMVGTRREASLIRFLGRVGLIPRSEVAVVHGTGDILRILSSRHGESGLKVITSTLFLKHHRHLVEARKSGDLLVA